MAALGGASRADIAEGREGLLQREIRAGGNPEMRAGRSHGTEAGVRQAGPEGCTVGAYSWDDRRVGEKMAWDDHCVGVCAD